MSTTAAPDTYRQALATKLTRERACLTELQITRCEAIGTRAPAYVLDEMRYAIYRQERVVRDLEALVGGAK